MRRHRWLAAALAPLLFSGCMMNARLRSDTLAAPGGSPGPGSGHAQSIGGALHWEGSRLGSAIVAAAAVAVIVEATRSGAAPEPEPARAIHEQDCTRPIENPSANLRCR